MDEKELNQVRQLVADPRFIYLKKYIENYITDNFPPHASIRRDTEFDTIWESAYAEGGRVHLETILANLDDL